MGRAAVDHHATDYLRVFDSLSRYRHPNEEFANDNAVIGSMTVSIYLLGYAVGPVFITRYPRCTDVSPS